MVTSEEELVGRIYLQVFDASSIYGQIGKPENGDQFEDLAVPTEFIERTIESLEVANDLLEATAIGQDALHELQKLVLHALFFSASEHSSNIPDSDVIHGLEQERENLLQEIEKAEKARPFNSEQDALFRELSTILSSQLKLHDHVVATVNNCVRQVEVRKTQIQLSDQLERALNTIEHQTEALDKASNITNAVTVTVGIVGMLFGLFLAFLFS